MTRGYCEMYFEQVVLNNKLKFKVQVHSTGRRPVGRYSQEVGQLAGIQQGSGTMIMIIIMAMVKVKGLSDRQRRV